MMKHYDISITETLCKVITIDAKSEKEAIIKVRELHDSGEIVLTADDYLSSEIDSVEYKPIL